MPCNFRDCQWSTGVDERLQWLCASSVAYKATFEKASMLIVSSSGCHHTFCSSDARDIHTSLPISLIGSRPARCATVSLAAAEVRNGQHYSMLFVCNRWASDRRSWTRQWPPELWHRFTPNNSTSGCDESLRCRERKALHDRVVQVRSAFGDSLHSTAQHSTAQHIATLCALHTDLSKPKHCTANACMHARMPSSWDSPRA